MTALYGYVNTAVAKQGRLLVRQFERQTRREWLMQSAHSRTPEQQQIAVTYWREYHERRIDAAVVTCAYCGNEYDANNAPEWCRGCGAHLPIW